MSGESNTDHLPLSLDEADKLRSEDRFQYCTAMSYWDGQGRKWEGVTQDVSLNGAFLLTTGAPQGVQVGDQGVVEMEVKKGNGHYTVTIPCTVARVTPRGLGLGFEEG